MIAYIPLCNQSSIWISFSVYRHPPLFFSHDFYVCVFRSRCSGSRRKLRRSKGFCRWTSGEASPTKTTPLQPLVGCVKGMIESLVVEIIWSPWSTALSFWNLKGVLEVTTMCAQVDLFFFGKISQIEICDLSQPSNLPNQLSIYHQGLVIRLGC